MSDAETPGNPDRQVEEPQGHQEGLHDAETEQDTASGGPADPPGGQDANSDEDAGDDRGD
jgi:hypothetical protein